MTLKSGTFYVIGVGPGDPDLVTLRGARTLSRCAVWLTPTAKSGGPSTALTIASGAVDPIDKTIISHHFPMKKVHVGKQNIDPEVTHAWGKAADLINDHLIAGNDVALPTLGDPAIYSTGFYVCQALLERNPKAAVEIIPGITATGATSAAAMTPLCLGDEQLAVIPAIFDNTRLREILTQFEAVAFMKVHKALDILVPLLEELDLLDRAVLVEQASTDKQRVHHDLLAAKDKKLHYFSTLIVRKNGWTRGEMG